MRFPYALRLAAVVAVLATTSEAAPRCVSPTERAAFEVAALKSDLMVAALECGDQDRYNAVVGRDRTELLNGEATLSSWFLRSYGGRGQSMRDDYVTQVANVRSRASYRAGDGYCAAQTGLFSEVEASGSGLAPIAASRAFGQPIRLQECASDAELPYDPPGPIRRLVRTSTRIRHVVVSKARWHASEPASDRLPAYDPAVPGVHGGT